MKKRVFLLDAYALIFRGYYAFIKNPRITSKGLNTSAIMGFLNSLLEVIRKEKPDCLAVAFDKGGSQQRFKLYDQYKANRDETPEAIKLAVPYIHQILEALHIPIIQKEGYEADDIIGTLAKQAEKQGLTIYMVTPDKDFGQLVSENIFVYRPARSGKDVEIWGVEEVKEKFGVENPLQVIDFLGMMGDAVDNIPGLPGVGEKTAKKLISEFGSMENLLQNTHLLKGKLRENIEANAEQGLLSKTLARIILDVPVEFNEADFQLSAPDMEAVVSLFDELEFKTLLSTLQKIYTPFFSETPTPSNEENTAIQLSLFENQQEVKFLTINDVNHTYQLINTPMACGLLLEKLMQQKSVCFDTETTSLNTFEAELVGIAFSWEKHKGYYLQIPENKEKAQAYLEQLRPFFENNSIEKIGQNLKYDLKVLQNYGIEVRGKLFDTMLAHYLLNPDSRHNMNQMAKNHLNYSPIEIETLIRKGKSQISFNKVPIDLQKEYAVEDADITLQLADILRSKLQTDQMNELLEKVEAPLVKVLASMEKEGIRIDVELLRKMSSELQTEIDQIEKEIFEMAGQEFNLSSPKQLGEILFDHLKINEKAKKTKTGQYATSEAILSELTKAHPIVNKVLEFRQMQKLQNTYLEALPNEVNPTTGRVHTTFMQTITATGRLSSNNPNLQNIPIRSSRGQQIRRAFIAKDENHTLLAADYSQIELRVIASLSQEPTMIQAFTNGEDIHRSTASKVFGVSLEEVSKEQRSHAKTINFGIIYGVSATGLSQQTDLTRSQSKELIDAYYATYPKLRQYIEQQIYKARNNGFVETILGRRRYLPDINSRNQVVRAAAERNAVNAPIQGSAADIIKIAMVRIHDEFQKEQLKSKMLLQVHDELIFDVYKPELEKVKHIIQTQMQNAYALEVPLVVEIGIADNWLEAH